MIPFPFFPDTSEVFSARCNFVSSDSKKNILQYLLEIMDDFQIFLFSTLPSSIFLVIFRNSSFSSVIYLKN